MSEQGLIVKETKALAQFELCLDVRFSLGLCFFVSWQTFRKTSPELPWAVVTEVVQV